MEIPYELGKFRKNYRNLSSLKIRLMFSVHSKDSTSAKESISCNPEFNNTIKRLQPPRVFNFIH